MERTPVTTLTDLVELVPSLLGFHAHDSIVLLAIQDDEVVLTARTDLVEHPAEGLAAAWRRLPGAELVVIAFSRDASLAWVALDDVDFALPDGTERILLHADGEYWYEAPRDLGVPYDAVASVHLVEAAWAGRPVRASRDELYALVEPQRTPAEVTASLERVASREATLSDVVGEARALVEAFDAAPGLLDIDDATVLCLASHDAFFLDEALMGTNRDNARSRLALWLQVVGASVPNCAGGALVAAALAAWLAGDGAMLTVCLETVVARPAPGVWVDLLDAVHRDAVPPQEWERVRAALDDAWVSTMPT